MARVLVVDDDAAALEIRKLVLERAGHQVCIAGTADQARQAPHCDVAVLDLRVPRVEDGLELIRDFRSRGARVVVLCGNRADLDGRAEAALADEILTKPVRSEMLLNAISQSADW